MDEELIFHYHEEADILYLFLGTPRHTSNYDIEQFVDVREDIDSGQVVGLTIRNCSHHYPNLLKVQPREAIREWLHLLNSMKEATKSELEPAYLLREKATTRK